MIIVTITVTSEFDQCSTLPFYFLRPDSTTSLHLFLHNATFKTNQFSNRKLHWLLGERYGS